MKNITGIVGSLREESFNKKLMKAAQELSPEEMEIVVSEIGNLPLFSEDLEANFPGEAHRLKETIEAADGVIFATPEYNRGTSGVLKNAIDWISRPYGQNSLAGKPVYVMGASIGPIGSALAQYQLKQSLNYLDTHILGQPEFYLGNASEKFADDGTLTDDDTREHLQSALEAFDEFVA